MLKKEQSDLLQVQAAETSQTAERPTISFDSDTSILDELKRVDQARRRGKHNNSLPVVDVVIPQTITIDCPLVRPYSRYASNCKKCDYFKGIAQTSWDDKNQIPWPAKYAIRCGFVLERKTMQVVVE